MERRDLTGMKFGKWTVISFAGRSKAGSQMWKCRCECGRESDVSYAAISYGNSTQCAKCARCKDLAGQSFGKLYVVERSRKRVTEWLWNCQCECGAEVEVRGVLLRQGKKTDCGCSRPPKTVVNGKQTPTYICWAKMIDRCFNPNSNIWGYYGGRGITVCERWRSYPNFLADMGERPGLEYSLDRYPDNDGNYEPGNARWATRAEQARNTRANVLLTHNGRTMCVADWSKETGVSQAAIRKRMDLGLPSDQVLAKCEGHLITFRGKTQRMKEWSEELGVNYSTLAKRINSQGWSVERALTTPPKSKSGM